MSVVFWLVAVGAGLLAAYWSGYERGAVGVRRRERERCVGILLQEMDPWDISDVNRRGKLIRMIEEGQS